MSRQDVTITGGTITGGTITGDKGLIVLAAGGTGGHVFPALAVAATLRERGYQTVLFTDRRGAQMVPKTDDDTAMRVISAASPFQGGPVQRLLAVGKIGMGMMASLMMMIRARPLVMIGFGGYPSFGPMAAAKMLFVPMILHEQNGFLGRANRALARLAGHLALSWSDTGNLPAGVESRIVGMPVRDAFFASATDKSATDKSATDKSAADKGPADRLSASGPIRILVIGGSQGAAVFADLVPAAIALMDERIRTRLQISQQCRSEQLAMVKAHYETVAVPAKIVRFFDDMPQRIRAAHLVIMRSGASAVAELAAAGRPAIMIPLPGAMDDHQTMNARQLENVGAGTILAQNTLNAAGLAAILADWLNDPVRLAAMGRNARRLARPDAAAQIADYALSLIAATPESCKGGTA